MQSVALAVALGAAIVGSCGAVHVRQGGVGRVKPIGRHIQYVQKKLSRAGLSDRLDILTWLVRMGAYHNATAHIRGGMTGADLFLNPKHSMKISSDWGRYFDTSAYRGNPFHDVVDFDGCVTVGDSDWTRIFDSGALCVNIEGNMHNFKHWYESEPRLAPLDMRPSRAVLQEATRLAVQARLPARYGAVHIRRCDRLKQNRQCTEPDNIYRLLKAHDNFTHWLVASYAEPGYIDVLKQTLAPLGRKLVFEEEFGLAPLYEGDNYFKFMVVNELKGAASLIFAAHLCEGPDVRTVVGPVNGQYLRSLLEPPAPLPGQDFPEVSLHALTDLGDDVREEATCLPKSSYMR